jgi:hypothetical protein
MTYQQHFEAASHARIAALFPAEDVAVEANPGKPIAGRFRLSVHDDLGRIEAEWRRFEAVADCTVFQTFA